MGISVRLRQLVMMTMIAIDRLGLPWMPARKHLGEDYHRVGPSVRLRGEYGVAAGVFDVMRQEYCAGIVKLGAATAKNALFEGGALQPAVDLALVA